jgi:hypothetical protein
LMLGPPPVHVAVLSSPADLCLQKYAIPSPMSLTPCRGCQKADEGNVGSLFFLSWGSMQAFTEFPLRTGPPVCGPGMSTLLQRKGWQWWEPQLTHGLIVMRLRITQ